MSIAGSETSSKPFARALTHNVSRCSWAVASNARNLFVKTASPCCSCASFGTRWKGLNGIRRLYHSEDWFRKRLDRNYVLLVPILHHLKQMPKGKRIFLQFFFFCDKRHNIVCLKGIPP